MDMIINFLEMNGRQLGNLLAAGSVRQQGTSTSLVTKLTLQLDQSMGAGQSCSPKSEKDSRLYKVERRS